MPALNITLNKKWFDMIASGEKKEEYREIKPYWETRLIDQNTINDFSLEQFKAGLGFKDFDFVNARNGYSKHAPTLKWEHLGITIGEGKPEWGAVSGVKYFILKIGEVVRV